LASNVALPVLGQFHIYEYGVNQALASAYLIWRTRGRLFLSLFFFQGDWYDCIALIRYSSELG
jgi:hypothetical protein